MTARFGRNKRRRAREQIAAQSARISVLELAHTMTSALLDHHRERLREVQEELSEAKDMAHGLSVLFPPHDYSVDDGLGAHIRRGGQVSISLPLPGNFIKELQEKPITPDSFSCSRLPVLLTKIHQDVIDSRVHVRVCFNDGSGETGYAINPRDFYQYPRDVMVKRVHKIIAPQIAAHLVAQFYPKG